MAGVFSRHSSVGNACIAPMEGLSGLENAPAIPSVAAKLSATNLYSASYVKYKSNKAKGADVLPLPPMASTAYMRAKTVKVQKGKSAKG